VIDDCDYYLVIVGGRYGSLTSDGVSYTQQEYEYAIQQSKPVLGFLHEDPDSIPTGKIELEPLLREKLSAFRELCRKRMCKFWKNPDDLGGKVSRSLINLINAQPGIGWVRGNFVPDESTSDTIITLRNQIDKLTQELNRVRREPPKGIEKLAQGNDSIDVHFTTGLYSNKVRSHIAMQWDDIFANIAPCMIDEASDYKISKLFGEAIERRLHKKDLNELYLVVDALDLNKLLVQLRALGLIAISEGKRGVRDKGTTFWSLTPYGAEYMNRLVAIRRLDA
jgi:hypothetical protein